jgi:hypothetical protein
MNMWERDRVDRLRTVEAIEKELERCRRGEAAAPNAAKRHEWRRKIAFLEGLKEARNKFGNYSNNPTNHEPNPSFEPVTGAPHGAGTGSAAQSA